VELVDFLFLIRLLSALLLLLFVGLLGWLTYRDLQLAERALPEAPRGDARLRVIGVGPASGDLTLETHFVLQPVTSIGRAGNSTVVLADRFSSSQHALLTYRNRHWLLEDLQSRNGTLLNDVPVRTPVVISEGDVIRIGDTELRFQQRSQN
jgi:hypothetical protein